MTRRWRDGGTGGQGDGGTGGRRRLEVVSASNLVKNLVQFHSWTQNTRNLQFFATPNFCIAGTWGSGSGGAPPSPQECAGAPERDQKSPVGLLDPSSVREQEEEGGGFGLLVP